ncbi:hypothetical protein KCU89_g14385, partial [Aureobasidium melanogenum]
MSPASQFDEQHEPIAPCPPTPRLRPVSDWDDPNLPPRRNLPRFPPDALDGWWPLYLGPSERTCAIALAEHAQRVEQLNNSTTPSQPAQPAREPVKFHKLLKPVQPGASSLLTLLTTTTTNEHWAVNRPPTPIQPTSDHKAPPPKVAPWIHS